MFPSLEQVRLLRAGASRHNLDNSGTILEVNLSWMLFNSAGAASHFNGEVNDAMAYVEEFTNLNKWKSFRIVGTWTSGRYHKADSGNWFYAVGDYLAVGSASVKVLENCEFEMSYTFNFFDRYNWDKGKGVEMLGKPVKDNELGRLHKVGFAHEFEMKSQSEVR